ncbi:MAG: riboflavin biosynthesis protein RibF [bacterium]
METIQLNASSVFDPAGLVVALGFFDGLHAAHTTLLERALAVATASHRPAAVYTFSTHVLSYLRREPFNHLSSLEDKRRYTEQAGFQKFIVFTVDDALVQLEPETFIERFLVGAAGIVIGFDFTFGRFGRGNADLLVRDGRLVVTVVEEIAYHGKKIGSTRIRDALMAGNLPLANRMLGHPYRIAGIVEKGKGRGKILGFPTANVDHDGYLLPKQGVYATIIDIGGKRYESMTNIGDNPTFSGNRITLEVNVFQFHGSIYGERVIVEFLAFRRGEIKYRSTADLIDQMHRDEQDVRAFFAAKEE